MMLLVYRHLAAPGSAYIAGVAVKKGEPAPRTSILPSEQIWAAKDQKSVIFSFNGSRILDKAGRVVKCFQDEGAAEEHAAINFSDKSFIDPRFS